MFSWLKRFFKGFGDTDIEQPQLVRYTVHAIRCEVCGEPPRDGDILVRFDTLVERTEDLPDPALHGSGWAYVSTRKEVWIVEDGSWELSFNVALQSFREDLMKVYWAIGPVGSLKELESLPGQNAHDALKHGRQTLEVLGEGVVREVFQEADVRWVMES